MITCVRIATIVAEHFDVPIGVIIHGTNRRRSFVRARQTAIYVAKIVRGLSYPVIGNQFRKDHTTCLHAVRKIRTEIETNPVLAAQVAHCCQLVENEMAEIARRMRERRITNALTLPLRISASQVIDLAGISPATLAKRIREGTMPLPVDKARERLFDRDAVLRALGLMAATPPAAPVEQVATW